MKSAAEVKVDEPPNLVDYIWPTEVKIVKLSKLVDHICELSKNIHRKLYIFDVEVDEKTGVEIHVAPGSSSDKNAIALKVCMGEASSTSTIIWIESGKIKEVQIYKNIHDHFPILATICKDVIVTGGSYYNVANFCMYFVDTYKYIHLKSLSIKYDPCLVDFVVHCKANNYTIFSKSMIIECNMMQNVDWIADLLQQVKGLKMFVIYTNHDVSQILLDNLPSTVTECYVRHPKDNNDVVNWAIKVQDRRNLGQYYLNAVIKNHPLMDSRLFGYICKFI